MKPTFVFLFIILIWTPIIGQEWNREIKDSLVLEVCSIIQSNKKLSSDTLRLTNSLEIGLYPYIQNFEESLRENYILDIYIALQTKCKEFAEVSYRVEQPDQLISDWKKIETMPSSLMKERECEDIFYQKNLKYLEPNGDTVLLSLTHEFWIDNFKDESYSKLSVDKINSCEFTIEFIESDNYIRKKLSNIGDKYQYIIIDKTDKYYRMAVGIIEQNIFYEFKIYY